jgi:hypothetical protein
LLYRLLILTTAVSVLLLCVVSADEAPLAPKEIVGLIKCLGSDRFDDREAAFEKLATSYEALPYLERVKDFENAEQRRRLDRLLTTHRKRCASRLIGSLLERGRACPLDLLIEVAAHNTNSLQGSTWKRLIALVNGIREREASLTRRKIPFTLDDFTKLPVVSTKTISEEHVAGSYRLVANNTESKLGLSGCMVICRGSVRADTISNCVILANGGINIGNASPGSTVTECVLFSDNDIICEVLYRSIAIARGKIQCDRSRESGLFQQVVDEKPISLFGPRFLGIIVSDGPTGVRVDEIKDAVFKGDALQHGDVIVAINNKHTPNTATLIPALREAIVTRCICEIDIQRDKENTKITIGYP